MTSEERLKYAKALYYEHCEEEHPVSWDALLKSQQEYWLAKVGGVKR